MPLIRLLRNVIWNSKTILKAFLAEVIAIGICLIWKGDVGFISLVSDHLWSCGKFRTSLYIFFLISWHIKGIEIENRDRKVGKKETPTYLNFSHLKEFEEKDII